MKLARWILVLHLVGIAFAIMVALHTDRDSTRMLALAFFGGIVGWITILSAIGYLLAQLIRQKAGLRDVTLLLILCFIGYVEQVQGIANARYLLGLPH